MMIYKLAFAAMAAGMSMPSCATVITRHYNVVATGFTNDAPVSTVRIKFSISLDNLTAIVGKTRNGLFIKSFNLVDYPAPFFTFYGGLFDALTIATHPGYNQFITSSGFKTFGLRIENLTTTPKVMAFQYTVEGEPFATFKATDTSVQELPAVPEPATWGMMALGFGLAGAAMRCRNAAGIAAA